MSEIRLPDVILALGPDVAWDYPISEGTMTYVPFREDHTDPNSRWLVSVPPSAVGPLLERGGFAIMRSPNPSPADMLRAAGYIRIKHRKDPTASFAGASPDEDGVLTVPGHHDFRAHGFVLEEESPATAPLPGPNAAEEAALLRLRVAALEAEKEAGMWNERPVAPQTRDGGGAMLLPDDGVDAHPEGGGSAQPATAQQIQAEQTAARPR
jgi:hypothetical protein